MVRCLPARVSNQGLAHSWKFCPIHFAALADMDEHKFTLGNERHFERMRERDETTF